MAIQETASALGSIVLRAVQDISVGSSILVSGLLIASALLIYPYINRYELTGSGLPSIIARLDRVTGEVVPCVIEKKDNRDDPKALRYQCNE